MVSDHRSVVFYALDYKIGLIFYYRAVKPRG